MTTLPIFEFGSPLDTLCQTGWIKSCNSMTLVNHIIYIPHEAVEDESVKQYVATVTVPFARATKSNLLTELEGRIEDFKESVKELSKGKIVL